MRKILSVVACGLLAACACDENQWEEVDVVAVDEVAYVEPVAATPAPVEVKKDPVYIPAPVYDCPCAEVQPMPCPQPTCYQPCACGMVQMPAPQPKVIKTKKIITTTTTIQEPCGKPVCEPIVTTHEEIVPLDAEVPTAPAAPVVKAPVVPVAANNSVSVVTNTNIPTSNNEVVKVTVEKNPYRSQVVEMKSSKQKVDATAVKYTPEAYVVVATRATNRMLQDTTAIYDNGKTKTVYLKDTKLLSSDLPYGSHRLKGTVKEIINGSKAYDVVNNSTNADFVLETSADWYVSPNNAAPALQYKLAMFDKNGKKVNEWVEVIRQVQD